MSQHDEHTLSEPSESIPPSSSPRAEDPVDLQRLRLSQDFAATVGVKKALLTVPVRKPTRQEFIRVHPSETWQLPIAAIELKEERETYLVDPALLTDLPGDVVPKLLFTAMSRQGVLFLWPIRLPGDDGRHDEWNRSALEAAQLGMQGWIKVAANMALGAYEVFQAAATLPDPVWPDVSFQEVLRVAFKDRFIQELDHPVLRRLRGEL